MLGRKQAPFLSQGSQESQSALLKAMSSSLAIGGHTVRVPMHAKSLQSCLTL